MQASACMSDAWKNLRTSSETHMDMGIIVLRRTKKLRAANPDEKLLKPSRYHDTLTSSLVAAKPSVAPMISNS